MKFVEVIVRNVKKSGRVQLTDTYIHTIAVDTDIEALDTAKVIETEKLENDGFTLTWETGARSFRADGTVLGNLSPSTIYVTFKVL